LQTRETPAPASGEDSGARPDLVGRFGLRRFATSAGLLSLTSIANFARAVIAAKLFAITLGPSNVGILAQLLNFSALVSVVVPLGLTTGVAKMVAEGRGDQRHVTRVTITASALALSSALVAAIVLAPAAGQISSALTGSSQYALPILLLVASFPLYNLSAVLAYVLQGLADVRRLTRANIITTALAVGLLVPLTLAYGLNGAIASVLVTSALQALVFGAVLWTAYAARAWRFIQAGFDRALAKQLLAYGGILLLGAVANQSSLLIVRTTTVHSLGQTANGLYQVVFGLSSQYITIFMAWMGAYVFPRLVAEGRAGRLNSLLNSGLRANLALMVPILVISIALRVPLIHVFYSASFVASAPLIPIQALGDYARIVGWSFAVCLFAVGHTRSHLLLIAAQATTWVLLATALVPQWGLVAIPASYALSFLTYPLMGIALTHHWVGARPDRTSILLIAVGLVCILGSMAPLYLGLVFAPAMPAIVYWLNRHELAKPRIAV